MNLLMTLLYILLVIQQILLVTRCCAVKYCKQCNEFEECQECQVGFQLNDLNTCKSSCTNNLIYDPIKDICVTSCDINQYVDIQAKTCQQIENCFETKIQKQDFHDYKIILLQELDSQYLMSYDSGKTVIIWDQNNNYKQVAVITQILTQQLIGAILLQNNQLLAYSQYAYSISDISESIVLKEELFYSSKFLFDDRQLIKAKSLTNDGNFNVIIWYYGEDQSIVIYNILENLEVSLNEIQSQINIVASQTIKGGNYMAIIDSNGGVYAVDLFTLQILELYKNINYKLCDIDIDDVIIGFDSQYIYYYFVKNKIDKQLLINNNKHSIQQIIIKSTTSLLQFDNDNKYGDQKKFLIIWRINTVIYFQQIIYDEKNQVLFLNEESYKGQINLTSPISTETIVYSQFLDEGIIFVQDIYLSTMKASCIFKISQIQNNIIVNQNIIFIDLDEKFLVCGKKIYIIGSEIKEIKIGESDYIDENEYKVQKILQNFSFPQKDLKYGLNIIKSRANEENIFRDFDQFAVEVINEDQVVLIQNNIKYFLLQFYDINSYKIGLQLQIQFKQYVFFENRLGILQGTSFLVYLIGFQMLQLEYQVDNIDSSCSKILYKNNQNCLFIACQNSLIKISISKDKQINSISNFYQIQYSENVGKFQALSIINERIYLNTDIYTYQILDLDFKFIRQNIVLSIDFFSSQLNLSSKNNYYVFQINKQLIVYDKNLEEVKELTQQVEQIKWKNIFYLEVEKLIILHSTNTINIFNLISKKIVKEYFYQDFNQPIISIKYDEIEQEYTVLYKYETFIIFTVNVMNFKIMKFVIFENIQLKNNQPSFFSQADLFFMNQNSLVSVNMYSPEQPYYLEDLAYTCKLTYSELNQIVVQSCTKHNKGDVKIKIISADTKLNVIHELKANYSSQTYVLIDEYQNLIFILLDFQMFAFNICTKNYIIHNKIYKTGESDIILLNSYLKILVYEDDDQVNIYKYESENKINMICNIKFEDVYLQKITSDNIKKLLYLSGFSQSNEEIGYVFIVNYEECKQSRIQIRDLQPEFVENMVNQKYLLLSSTYLQLVDLNTYTSTQISQIIVKCQQDDEYLYMISQKKIFIFTKDKLGLKYEITIPFTYLYVDKIYKNQKTEDFIIIIFNIVYLFNIQTFSFDITNPYKTLKIIDSFYSKIQHVIILLEDGFLLQLLDPNNLSIIDSKQLKQYPGSAHSFKFFQSSNQIILNLSNNQIISVDLCSYLTYSRQAQAFQNNVAYITNQNDDDAYIIDRNNQIWYIKNNKYTIIKNRNSRIFCYNHFNNGYLLISLQTQILLIKQGQIVNQINKQINQNCHSNDDNLFLINQESISVVKIVQNKLEEFQIDIMLNNKFQSIIWFKSNNLILTIDIMNVMKLIQCTEEYFQKCKIKNNLKFDQLNEFQNPRFRKFINISDLLVGILFNEILLIYKLNESIFINTKPILEFKQKNISNVFMKQDKLFVLNNIKKKIYIYSLENQIQFIQDICLPCNSKNKVNINKDNILIIFCELQVNIYKFIKDQFQQVQILNYQVINQSFFLDNNSLILNSFNDIYLLKLQIQQSQTKADFLGFPYQYLEKNHFIQENNKIINIDLDQEKKYFIIKIQKNLQIISFPISFEKNQGCLVNIPSSIKAGDALQKLNRIQSYDKLSTNTFNQTKIIQIKNLEVMQKYQIRTMFKDFINTLFKYTMDSNNMNHPLSIQNIQTSIIQNHLIIQQAQAQINSNISFSLDIVLLKDIYLSYQNHNSSTLNFTNASEAKFQNITFVNYTSNFCYYAINVNSSKKVVIQDILINFEQQSEIYGLFFIDLVDVQASSYSIFNSTFINNYNEGCNSPAIFDLHQIKLVLLYSITIEKTKSIDGSTLTIYQVIQAIIEQCTFSQNTSYQKGGALATSQSQVYICHSIIKENSAFIGGGVFYLKNKPVGLCYFQNNEINIQELWQRRQVLINHQFIVESQIQQLSEQIYENIATFYGNNLGSEPETLEITDIQPIEGVQFFMDNKNKILSVKNFRSGEALNLSLQIKDEEGRALQLFENYASVFSADIIDMIQSQKIEVIQENNESIIQFDHYIVSTPKDFDYQTNKFNFNYPLQIIGSPNTTQSMKISYLANIFFSSQYELIIVDQIKILITFKSCQIGEIQVILEKDLIECIPCKEGFYSLENPSNQQIIKCNRCPDSALKCHRNIIQLKQGYWRSSDKSENIIYCKKKPQNCIGSKEGNINYCEKGYVGPLCEACDSYGLTWGQKYMRRQGFSCEPCDGTNNLSFILPTVLLIVSLIVYLVFSINTTLKISKAYAYLYYFRKMGILSVGGSVQQNQTSFYLKELMHYLQIIYYINTYDFNFPDIIQFIPASISSPFQNIQYDFDCILIELSNKTIPITFIRAIWTLAIPIAFFLILFLFYMILLALKVISKNRYYVSNSVLFILFFMQPGVLSDLISTISCSQIDNISYVHSDKKYLCYTQDHIKYSLVIIFPGLLLWGAIIPMYTLYLLKKNKNNLDSVRSRFLYGFLYQDYSKKYYYWEIIKSYKKTIIVGLYNFFFDYPYTRLIFTSMLLIMYKQLIQIFQPYLLIKQNVIDGYITIILLCILNMNILLKDNTLQWMDNIGFYSTALIHNSLLILFIFKIILIKFESLYPRFFFKLQNILKKNIPFVFSCLKPIFPINIKRVQINWKKVIKQVQIIIQSKKMQTGNFKQDQNYVFQNYQNFSSQKGFSDKQRVNEYEQNEKKIDIAQISTNKIESNILSPHNISSQQSIQPLNNNIYSEDLSKIISPKFNQQIHLKQNKFQNKAHTSRINLNKNGDMNKEQKQQNDFLESNSSLDSSQQSYQEYSTNDKYKQQQSNENNNQNFNIKEIEQSDIIDSVSLKLKKKINEFNIPSPIDPFPIQNNPNNPKIIELSNQKNKKSDTQNKNKKSNELQHL